MKRYMLDTNTVSYLIKKHSAVAHALSAKAVLVTNDRAFYQITHLQVEDWTN